MNSEQYLNYLQESQHIAKDSFNFIGELYEYYVISMQYDEYLQNVRGEKIDEILE